MIEAARTIELLSAHGSCVSQDASDWQGTIALPDEVAQFYAEVGPQEIEIEGYGNCTSIPSLAELWQYQAGYRWDALTGERIDDWPDSWFVVADEGGDPYIYDADTRQVLFAQHGMGTWEAGELYANLNTMAACLATLGNVILNAEEFTDDDERVKPQYREQAVSLLAELLGSRSEAEAIVETAGWG